MIDGLTSSLVSAALAIINLFPQSPFRPLISQLRDTIVYQYLQWVNWLLPVSEMISILSLWLVGVSVYYLYQIILRWARVIE